MQSKRLSRSLSSAPWPVSAVSISMSGCDSSSLTPKRSASLSSAISRRLRRGLTYSLILLSAALRPSVVVGLLR